MGAFEFDSKADLSARSCNFCGNGSNESNGRNEETCIIVQKIFASAASRNAWAAVFWAPPVPQGAKPPAATICSARVISSFLPATPPM